MTKKAALRAIPSTSKRNSDKTEWAPNSTPIVVGKDILELLSTSMYVDPMTIYREYVQNAADAIDDARAEGLISSRSHGTIDISIDPITRSIRIRDNGTGVSGSQFAKRLSNLGASNKRGTSARGFRGVGRLAGLGYCQELIFRSRIEGEQHVSELRWDCRALKSALRGAQRDLHLLELVQEIVSIRLAPTERSPTRFFEVELKNVIRHRNDRLLSAKAVEDYLAQVAPVPFSPEFTLGREISDALRPYVDLGDLRIRINESEQPVYRPHRDAIELSNHERDEAGTLEIIEIPAVDGSLAAIAWILHHGYHGALPKGTLVKGLRFRTGNIQVGAENLLEDLFPEPRFNSWAVGEIHVVDKKVLPNGRRDQFEQSVHFDNILSQLTPVVRNIAKRCRESSIGRKWIREFEIHEQAALDGAMSVRRGGLSRPARQRYVDGIAKSLQAMRKVAATRHIGDEMRSTLSARVDATESRIEKLIGDKADASDPLMRFKPQVRAAYQQVIELIYECTTNNAAATSLVEKILARLSAENEAKPNAPRTSRIRKPKSGAEKRRKKA